MEPSSDAQPAGNTAAKGGGGRFRSIAMIVVFDVAGPLVAYSLLRSAGMPAVSALLLSGVFPAMGVTINAVQHRRLDVVGALVLAGIAVGTALGLVSHDARLLLVEGSVPTTVFGVACLGSLWARRPLMFSFALEFTGPDTAQGREMTRLWQYEGYQRVFRVITVVWGAGFLLEAALRVFIVYNTSAGTALAISKVTPFLFVGILSAWTVAYGAHHKKKGERMAAAASQATGTDHAPPPGDREAGRPHLRQPNGQASIGARAYIGDMSEIPPDKTSGEAASAEFDAKAEAEARVDAEAEAAAELAPEAEGEE